MSKPTADELAGALDPMSEHSRDLTPRQLETLAAPAALTLPDDEDFTVDPLGLYALDIDHKREGCPVVLRLHPALAALLDTFKR